MSLTDIAIRNAKTRDKPYKMYDEKGLFLVVSPSGGRHWRMKYRRGGSEKKLSFGPYPHVSLRDARRMRDDAREMLSEGKDPAFEKHRTKLRAAAMADNTFTSVANEYCSKRRRDGDKAWAPATAARCEYLLSLLDSSIGKMPIHEIEPIDALSAIRKIEKRGKLESARRTLQLAGAVFRYAVATARLRSDPTRDLRGALTMPTVTHYGAVTDASEIGELLRAIDSYEGQGMTKWALRLAPHVFVRPGELRHARWDEIDFQAKVWIIPAEKMKMRKPHHVPLSRQSIAILEEIRSILGSSGYVFPSMRSRTRPMSDNTINAALRRLGYASNEMTAHGFRAMASTILNESGKWSADAIERALAHGDRDKVRAAYHRGTHWAERVRMAQWWSDRLDRLRSEGQVDSPAAAPVHPPAREVIDSRPRPVADRASTGSGFAAAGNDHSALPWPLFTLDFEASSLNAGTYPIEVGVCRWGGPDQPMEGWSTLIRPTASWIERGAWSTRSALIHGIRREDLEKGVEPEEALARLNSIIGFRGRAFVDGGEHDAHWLNMLIDASSDGAIFSLANFIRLSLHLDDDQQARLDRYLELTPTPHRALDDSRRLMRSLAAGLGIDQPEAVSI